MGIFIIELHYFIMCQNNTINGHEWLWKMEDIREKDGEKSKKKINKENGKIIPQEVHLQATPNSSH